MALAGIEAQAGGGGGDGDSGGLGTGALVGIIVGVLVVGAGMGYIGYAWATSSSVTKPTDTGPTPSGIVPGRTTGGPHMQMKGMENPMRRAAGSGDDDGRTVG